MKKCLAFLVICSLMLSLFLYGVADETRPEVYTSGDWEYIVLEDGTAEITGYCNDETETVVIPEEIDAKKVVGIGDRAFIYLETIHSITIPDNVTSIGINPFQFCSGLMNIIVSPDHSVFATINGVLFDKKEKKLICYPCAFKDDHYEVPQGIQVIGADAFCSCDSLARIAIPDSVTSIGDEAFFHCASLTRIMIPDSVTSIGEIAFDGCDSLTVTVGHDSYAARYCKDNGLKYQYPDSNDWLNN